MNNLDRLRAGFAPAMIGVIAFSAALVVLAALLLMDGGWVLAVASLAVAGGSAAMWRADPTGASTRIVTSAALAAQVAMLVYAFAGHAFQIDMHMYFFAALAISAGWVDEKAVLANAATVALHHIVLNFLLPFAVFPETASDLPRLAIHAVILVAQAIALCWLALRLQQAFDVADKARAKAEEASRAASELAASQSRRAEDESGRRGDIQRAVAGFRNEVASLIDALRDQARQMAKNTNSLNALSASAAQDAAQAAENASDSSGSIGAVAAATEQLSQSVSEIHGQIGGMKAIIDKVHEAAGAAQSNVGDLMEEANRISDVVTIIQDIAGQTNLLALNATIEAARAGDMGKGFAVVAGEVKVLADQTAKATSDISSRIAAISASTRSTVGAMEDIARNIDDAAQYAGAIVSSIDQQRVATSEIASNVSQVAGSTRKAAEMSRRSSETARSTDQSSTSAVQAANSVESAADGLAKTIESFLRGLAA